MSDKVFQNFKAYYQFKNSPEGKAAAEQSNTAVSFIAWLSSTAQASVFGPAAVDGVMQSTVLNLPDNIYSRGFAYFSAFDSVGSNLLLGVACTERFIYRIINTFKGVVCEQGDLHDWEYDILLQSGGFKSALRLFSELAFLGISAAAALPFLCLPIFGNADMKVDPNASIWEQLISAFSDVPRDILGLGIFQYVTTIPVLATGLFEIKDSIEESLGRVFMDDESYRVEQLRDGIVGVLEDIRENTNADSQDLKRVHAILQLDDPMEILRELLKVKLNRDHVSNKDVNNAIQQNSRSNGQKLADWLTDYKAYGRRLYMAIAYTVCISSLLGYAHYAAGILCFGSMAMYAAVFAMVFIPLAGLTMRSTGPVASGLLDAVCKIIQAFQDRFNLIATQGITHALDGITLNSCKQFVLDNKTLLLTLGLTIACGFPNLRVNELFMNPADYTGIKNFIAWFLLGTALVSAPAVNGYYGHSVMKSMVEKSEEDKLREQDPSKAESLIDTRYRLDAIKNYVSKLHNEKLADVFDKLSRNGFRVEGTNFISPDQLAVKHLCAESGLNSQQVSQTFFRTPTTTTGDDAQTTMLPAARSV